LPERARKEVRNMAKLLFHSLVGSENPTRACFPFLQADVVVMATHGRKGRFEFGSVTEKVVKTSPVPVWTVRPFKRKSKK
jgi:nucleotide-binding universal stress UspA family protein